LRQFQNLRGDGREARGARRENFHRASITAAESPKKSRNPIRFNWPKADKVQPAALANTENRTQNLMAGTNDITDSGDHQ
jgi:hypothetical protein